MTTPQLFQRVALVHDISAHGLKRGDVAVLVDVVPHPSHGAVGAVLEVFNAIGDSIATVVVSSDDIEPLAANEILTVRLRADKPLDSQQPA